MEARRAWPQRRFERGTCWALSEKYAGKDRRITLGLWRHGAPGHLFHRARNLFHGDRLVDQLALGCAAELEGRRVVRIVGDKDQAPQELGALLLQVSVQFTPADPGHPEAAHHDGWRIWR